MVYGAASVYKGINLRGREAYTTVPNKLLQSPESTELWSAPSQGHTAQGTTGVFASLS